MAFYKYIGTGGSRTYPSLDLTVIFGDVVDFTSLNGGVTPDSFWQSDPGPATKAPDNTPLTPPAGPPIATGGSVPGWAATTLYSKSQAALDPNGNLIVRIAGGTSRSTYDATEQAAWTTVSSVGQLGPALPLWTTGVTYTAKQAVQHPTTAGLILIRITSGVARNAFDATEAALWTQAGAATYESVGQTRVDVQGKYGGDLGAAYTAEGAGKAYLLTGTTHTIDNLIIGDNTTIEAPAGLAVTVKVKGQSDGGSGAGITNVDHANGNTGIRLRGFLLDGNKARQNGDTFKTGVFLVGVSSLDVDLDIANVDGIGFYHTGIAGKPFIEKQRLRIYAHDNTTHGVRNTLRTRKVEYDVVARNNGRLGVYLDHSEASGHILADTNGWDGCWVHNVHACADLHIVASRNGGAGVLVTGFCDSEGNFVAFNNGKTGVPAYATDSGLPTPSPVPTATADLYFSGDNTLSYGRTARAKVYAVAGFDQTSTLESEVATAAYAVYVEDSVDVAITGRLLSPEVTGSIRLPTGGTATFEGPSRTAYLTADQTITNTSAAVNITNLAVPVEANAVYEIDGVIYYDATTTAQAKFRWSAGAPAGISGRWHAVAIQSGATGNTGQAVFLANDYATAAFVGAAGAGTQIGMRVQGTLIMGATAGTMQIAAAQQAAEATNLVVRAGSRIRLKRVA